MIAYKLIRYLFYLLILVPPLIFLTDFTQNPYYIQGVLLNIIILLIWGIWIIKSLIEKKVTFIKTCLDIPFGLFFFVCLFSFICSLFAHWQMKEAVYVWGFKKLFFLLNNVILVFYGAVYFLSDKKNLKKNIYLIFLLTFLVCGYGLLQYLGLEIIWKHNLNPFSERCISTFGNPNFLSTFLVLVLPLIFGFFIKECSFLKKILFFTLFFLAFITLLFTFCRSSWLGFLSAFICMFGLWSVIDKRIILRNKKWLISFFVLIVLIVSFFPRSRAVEKGTNVVERAYSTFSVRKSNQSVYQRLLIWKTALAISRDNLFFGCGWGCFELFYPFYQGQFLNEQRFRHFRTHANNAHNEILEILSQVGIIGLLVFCYLLFCLGKYCYYLVKRLSRIKTKREEKVLIPCFIGAITGVFVDSMFNVSLHFPVPAFFLWLNVGFLINMGEKVEGRENSILIDLKKTKNKGFLKNFYLLSIIFLSLIGIIICKEIKDFAAVAYFFKGHKLSGNSNFYDKAIIEYKKAYRLNPFCVRTNYQLGNLLTKRGNIKGSLRAYQDAIRAHPGYDEIYFNLGVQYSKIKQWEKAVENYKQALKINPLNIFIHINLGQIYLEKEMLNEGLMLYNRALKLDSDNKDIYNNLGYIYTKMKNWKKARECYLKALQIDPDFSIAGENLFFLQKRLKDIGLNKDGQSP